MDQKANGVENLANLGEGLRGIRLFPGWLSSGLAARNSPMRRMGRQYRPYCDSRQSQSRNHYEELRLYFS